MNYYDRTSKMKWTKGKSPKFKLCHTAMMYRIVYLDIVNVIQSGFIPTLSPQYNMLSCYCVCVLVCMPILLYDYAKYVLNLY